MLESFIDPIPSLQDVKNQADQFKTETGTTLTYEQYSELLLSASTNHGNKFNQDTKFNSKCWRSVYKLEELPNYGDEASFDIYSYVDIIHAYSSQQQSSFSIIPREQWYWLSEEEKGSWDKFSEAAKDTVLINTETPHRPSNHVKFHYVTLGDIIKASSRKFGVAGTPNGPSNYDLIYGGYHTDNDGGTYIILTKISKRGKVSPSDISKNYTQVMKEL